jgi:hypothetical protein
MDMKITFRDMVTARSAGAHQRRGQRRAVSTFSAIKRKDLKRVVTVSSNVIAGYNNNEVVQRIKDEMAAAIT